MVDQLRESSRHIQVAVDQGSVSEAEQALAYARDATRPFDEVGAWSPAQSAKDHLSTAANEMQKAADLTRIGLQSANSTVIAEAKTHETTATVELGHALAASEALGKPCA